MSSSRAVVFDDRSKRYVQIFLCPTSLAVTEPLPTGFGSYRFLAWAAIPLQDVDAARALVEYAACLPRALACMTKFVSTDVARSAARVVRVVLAHAAMDLLCPRFKVDADTGRLIVEWVDNIVEENAGAN